MRFKIKSTVLLVFVLTGSFTLENYDNLAIAASKGDRPVSLGPLGRQTTQGRRGKIDHDLYDMPEDIQQTYCDSINSQLAEFKGKIQAFQPYCSGVDAKDDVQVRACINSFVKALYSYESEGKLSAIEKSSKSYGYCQISPGQGCDLKTLTDRKGAAACCVKYVARNMNSNIDSDKWEWGTLKKKRSKTAKLVAASNEHFKNQVEQIKKLRGSMTTGENDPAAEKKSCQFREAKAKK